MNIKVTFKKFFAVALSAAALGATFLLSGCAAMKDTKSSESVVINQAVKVVFDKLKDQDVDARAIGILIPNGKLGKLRFVPFWRKLTPEQAAFVEAFLKEADRRNHGVVYEGNELKYTK